MNVAAGEPLEAAESEAESTEAFDQAEFGDHLQDVEFQFEKSGKALEKYIEDIADTVRIGLDQSIAILTPWFFSNMPRMYYQTTPRAEKVRHLSAVITGHIFETKQTVELWDHSHTRVTYIGPGSDQRILNSMAKKLQEISIKMGSLYFSRDKLLYLSTFICKEFIPADLENDHISAKITQARELIKQDFGEADQAAGIEHYLSNLDHDFVMYATPSRLRVSYRMLQHMVSHEGAHTIIEPFENSASGRLTLGLKGITVTEVLDRIYHMMYAYGFEIVRSFLIHFSEGYAEPITVVHFTLRLSSGEMLTKNHISTIRLIKALRALGWVDSDEYNPLMEPPYDLSITATNLMRAVASWVHILLGKENIYYFSEHKVRSTFLAYPELTNEFVVLFRIRVDPLRAKERDENRYEGARAELADKVEKLIDRVERNIFREAINFCDHILKTNYFVPTKTGLAFRLDPGILDERHYPHKPFGIFFIVGRDYRFFQVRWKDVARGGLRIVMPRGSTDYTAAISGHFDEVYGLSHAQQLKNKDIPEGGSKAVMVVKPGGNRARAVRGGINALLDLLVSEDETLEDVSSRIVSYYPHEEIIYLGPDENMTNDLIEWVPRQARRRRYQYAEAFISSKPDAGINHKEYGVTSEGVHVFVDHTLRFMGITPEDQRFTVKMTGGPDGDVAGNELKILHREYGENARIVAIADGFGAAHDPDGLAWNELLRLVEEEKSICHFDPACLSGGPQCYVIQADTSENIKKRNELHAIVKTDIFIPAGGRPYTVNEKNWSRFIDENGVPSCRAIIEGANIFFTQDARDELERAGVIIVKDSSANKTGVICSSYEIIASLLLTEEEFSTIKADYVAQVIDTLRDKARSEAQLLFSEVRKKGSGTSLVSLSTEISREINGVTDLILDEFLRTQDEVLANTLMQNRVLAHCPPILRERFGERILERLPKAHQIAILAASIASHIVYREGLGWLDGLGDARRFQAAMTYMANEDLASSLINAIATSAIDHRDDIAAVLARSAARDLTMRALET